MMARLTLPTYVLILVALGFPPDCVLSVTTSINAFTDDKRLLGFIQFENSTKHECFLYSDSGNDLPINEAHVTRVTSEELENYLKNCTKIRVWPTEQGRRRKRLSYPGTKWCGIGNIAKNYSDLGEEKEIDMCCREHDHCPTYIKPFKTKYGLYNLSFYTSSHCDCDRKFRVCLQLQVLLDNKAALFIYNIYFLFLRMRCIEEKTERVCIRSWFFTCRQYQMQTKMVFSQP